MNLIAKSWALYASQHPAISRVLVRFPETRDAEALIHLAVHLAQSCQARLRGLTLVDTSRLDELTLSCESAASAVIEQKRLSEGDAVRERVRASFSQACLAAGIDFDLHRKRGRRLEILRDESKVHDLTMTSVCLREHQKFDEPGTADILEMILAGISPLLVLRENHEFPQRILLVQDGSQASSQSLRSFLSQGLFPSASFRLLIVGHTASIAKQTLRDSIDLVAGRLPHLETGYVIGRPPQVVPSYVDQWEADLVVTGVQRNLPLMRSLLGETARQVLNKTRAALYSAS